MLIEFRPIIKSIQKLTTIFCLLETKSSFLNNARLYPNLCGVMAKTFLRHFQGIILITAISTTVSHNSYLSGL